MIKVELKEDQKTANIKLDGSLGSICRELALVITTIADNKELEMTDEDVWQMIKEELTDINYEKGVEIEKIKHIEVEADVHKAAKQKALDKGMTLKGYIAELVKKDK